MAWTADVWSQDDSKFFGYPFVSDAGIADEYDGNLSIWKLESGKFFDYPFIKSAGIADEYGSQTNGILYFNDVLVEKLYFNDYEVKKCYFNDVLVYTSS